MARLIRRVALGLSALLLAAWGVGSLDWRPARATGPLRTLAHLSAQGPLRAAAARVEITPQHPVTLAGYAARYRKVHERVADPIFARALLLQAGPPDSPRVALVSVELLLVTRELSDAVAERVKDLALGGLVVAATHTHSGPGGYARGRIQQSRGMGAFDPAIERELADGIARAVREAAARPMQAVSLQGAVLATEGIALDRNGGGGMADAPLTSARLVVAEAATAVRPEHSEAAAPRVAARLFVYGMHPTTYNDLDLVLSGDWPGRAMRQLEEEGKEEDGSAGRRAEAARPEHVDAAALFFQGAGGDATFFRREDIEKEDRAGVTGFRVAQLARATAVAHAPTREVKLEFTEVEVGLPPAEARAAPWVARRLASNLLDRAAPRTTRVARLSLTPAADGESKLVLQFVPGEPVSALGKKWSADGGGTVVGLANDDIGTIETPENVVAGEREAPYTYFGPSLANVIEDALRAAREAR